jgi:hypothetical protein
MSGVGMMLLAGDGGLGPYSGNLTVGYWLSAGSVDNYGFSGVLGGSIAPTAWGTNTINGIFWRMTQVVTLSVLNTVVSPNWTTLVIGGVSFTRASATFNGTTQWQWSSVVTNPFGTTVGAIKTITIS